MKSFTSKVFYLLGFATILAALVYAFLPTPVLVETQLVTRGELRVTVEEDGKTRIKEKYVVSSPLAGRLARVQLHAGDEVRGGETILTTLDPTAPTLLDARSRAEAVAKVKAADAARKRADTSVEQTKATARFAQEEFDRAKALFETNGTSHEDRDRAELRLRTATEAFKAAQFAQQIAKHELSLARAALIHTQRGNGEQPSDEKENDWRIEIRSPITGRVLRVFQESSAVVAPGTPLMELGDPTDLEVVVDVLSSDAVRIAPSNAVSLEEWGGEKPLAARVRHVEPSGFTKISALGVEEQRVNVIIDLTDPLELRRTLGDDFRVEAHVLIDHAHDVLKIPNGAIFRHNDHPAIFVATNGRAMLRTIATARRNRLETEVTSGLTEGDHVIVYPSDKVHQGVKVQRRAIGS